MRTLLLASIAARRSSTALTAVAVVIGVAFVTAALVMTDSMRAALLDTFSRSPRALDAVVEKAAEDPLAGASATVPSAVLDEVLGVAGVEAAAGDLWSPVTVLGPDQERLDGQERRAVLLGIPAEQRLWSFRMLQGHAPGNADEIVVDRATTGRNRLVVGDELLLPGLDDGASQRYRITGLIEMLPGETRFRGAVIVGMAADVAVVALDARSYGRVDVLAERGLSQEALRGRIADRVGDAYQVRTGEAVRQEEVRDAVGELDALTYALLGFSALAVLVAGFVILNTFSILVAQRVREIALLRCVGATRRQVFALVLGEAASIGLAASLIGLLVGAGLALGLLGLVPPVEGVQGTGGVAPQLQPRTAVVALLVGLIATVTVASVPAIRATRVLPVAALRRQQPSDRPARLGARSAVTTAGVGTLGIAATAGGTFASQVPGRSGLLLVAAGILVTIGAVLAAAPLFVPGLAVIASRVLGRVLGPAVSLSGQNLQVHPVRTAMTSAALIIGLALCTVVGTVAASMTAWIELRSARAFPFVSALEASAGEEIPPALVDRLSGRVEIAGTVAVVSGGSQTEAIAHGRVLRLRGIDTAVRELAPDAVEEGSLARWGPDTVAVTRDVARSLDLDIGDVLTVQERDGEQQLRLELVALLDAASPFGPVAVSTANLDRVVPDPPITELLVMGNPDVLERDVLAAVRSVVGDFPTVTVISAAQQLQQQTQAIEALRRLLLALLGLSVLVAFFSIANTLWLSVVERTWESAVLRALGMTRRQLRGMLLAESAILAVIGTAVGMVLGIAAGWALASSLQSDPTPDYVLPLAQMASLAVLAVLAGTLSGVLPSRRAARASIPSALRP